MYEFTSRIRFSETDENSDLHISALVDYFQDCTIFNSEDVGLGVDVYKEMKKVWVLNSWQIDIKRMPKLCEEVIIGTFPHAFTGFLGHRNFYMKTKKGELLAVANSMWALVNFETQRPVKPTEDIVEKYKVEEKLDMEYLDRKVVLTGEPCEEEAVVINRSQLDSNHHANNSQYVKLAVDYLPKGRTFDRIRVEYKKAALLGDRLRPMIYETGDVFAVSFCDEEDKVYVSVEFSTAKA